jgi:enterochelin esterase family protein
MMLTDLIPMVERSFRAAQGRENRAMAGLSMGGAQTFGTALANLDKFAYIGGFSGSSGGRGGFDPKTSNDGVFADAAAFNKKVKVLFLGIGSAEGPGTKTFSEQLTGRHPNVIFRSPVRHTSLTAPPPPRFAPRLFRKAASYSAAIVTPTDGQCPPTVTEATRRESHPSRPGR